MHAEADCDSLLQVEDIKICLASGADAEWAVERAEWMLSRNGWKWAEDDKNFEKIVRYTDEIYRQHELTLLVSLQKACEERRRLEQVLENKLLPSVR